MHFLWFLDLGVFSLRWPSVGHRHPLISDVMQTDFGVKRLMILLKVVKRWPFKKPIRTEVLRSRIFSMAMCSADSGQWLRGNRLVTQNVHFDLPDCKRFQNKQRKNTPQLAVLRFHPNGLLDI